MNKLYIIGAGGFGREVAWLVERINSIQPSWDLQGFIDDNADKIGKLENGYPVVGGCDYLENCEETIWVVCAVGSSRVREKIITQVKQYRNVMFATLIDPNVQKSQSVLIGEGSIICAGTICTVNVNIGKHVIINLDCTVGHDVVLENYVTVYPSVNVSGCVYVGKKTEIGTGTQIIQGKMIGSNSVIGAGSVIIHDLPSNCTAVGVPAKVIKDRN